MYTGPLVRKLLDMSESGEAAKSAPRICACRSRKVIRSFIFALDDVQMAKVKKVASAL